MPLSNIPKYKPNTLDPPEYNVAELKIATKTDTLNRNTWMPSSTASQNLNPTPLTLSPKP